MAKAVRDNERQRALQRRTLETRSKIISGVIEVLAQGGVPSLTHRTVAKAAGVSLAATTYHFGNLDDIIEAASETLLSNYLTAFQRLEGRLRSRVSKSPADLHDLVARVVQNALGRDATRSLAWSELILYGARQPHHRILAAKWYRQLDTIWHEIQQVYDPGASPDRARAAVDLAIGVTMTLRPLALQPDQWRSQFAILMQAHAEQSARHHSPAESIEKSLSPRRVQMRQALAEAAIQIIADEGVRSLSYSRLAEATCMVRSGPSYYFPTISDVIAAAQALLFQRAKRRYRDSLSVPASGALDRERLADLTATIFLREVLEFGRENIGYYAIWLEGARNPELRATISADIVDLNLAWQRRLSSVIGRKVNAIEALHMQALFTGKLIRAVASSSSIADLATTRLDFKAALNII